MMMSQTEAMKIKKKVPVGYKQTAIGVFPEEWAIESISNIGKVSSGGTPDTQKNHYWNGEINWCTPTDITALKGNKYINSTKTKISKSGLKNSSSILLPEFSLIICTRASIGKAAINTIPISTNQGFKNITDFKKTNVVYLYYRILLDQKKLIRIANGSTFLEVSKSDFNKLLIPIPPLEEQKRIVAILNTWDEAIENVQMIIINLKKRNRGLAKQILTGKKRINGFTKEWKKIRILDIASQQVVYNKNNIDFEVLSCTKHDGLVKSLDYFGRQIFGDDLSKYKIVPKNSFAYATNHIEEGSIGYQNILDQGLISPMYTVFKTNKYIHDSFLYKLLKTEKMIYEYQSNMIGSINRRGGLRWKDFSRIFISIPEKQEQLAIDQRLSAADQELRLYQKKLNTLKEQKKGLMQKLLTGEIRVETESVEASN